MIPTPKWTLSNRPERGAMCECGHIGLLHRRSYAEAGLYECVHPLDRMQFCPCKNFREVKSAQGESTMTTKGKKKAKRTMPARPKKQKKADTSESVGPRKRGFEAITLAGLVKEQTKVFATFKGTKHEATLMPDGTLKVGSEQFDSFSAAAKHVTGGASINGWTFWKHSNGEAVDTLRKKKEAA